MLKIEKVSHNLKRMSKLVKDIRLLEKIMGSKELKVSQKEKNSRIWATRSIHAKEYKEGRKNSILRMWSFKTGKRINPKILNPY